MLRIPFNSSNSSDQTLSVLIPEKQVITLRLVWNTRALGWDVEVSYSTGVLGMFRLKPNWPLLYEHKALSPIEGDIIALPVSGSKQKLDEYEALGTSWGLYWLSEEDLKIWEKANGLG